MDRRNRGLRPVWVTSFEIRDSFCSELYVPISLHRGIGLRSSTNKKKGKEENKKKREEKYHPSAFKDSLFLPPLPKQSHTNRRIRLPFDILNIQQLILPSKRQKVRKERIKMRLGAQMEDLRVVSVVHVRKHAEKLAIDAPDS